MRFSIHLFTSILGGLTFSFGDYDNVKKFGTQKELILNGSIGVFLPQHNPLFIWYKM